MAINTDWHKKNRMIKNPTEEQRIQWHINHTVNCDCRKPSEKMMEEIKKYELQHTGK